MSDGPEVIKILIVDDHQVVRQGLRTFLELHDDLCVVGEAGDGVEAVNQVSRLQPDIVLMDLVMPKLDGVAATAQIRSLGVRTKVIALTSFTEDDRVFPAIQAGASSYLLKDVSPDELVEAIRAVQRGEARVHPEIVRKLMEKVAQPASPPPALQPQAAVQPKPPTRNAEEAVVEELTEREREVTRLIALGRSNREIADELVISEKTVKTHVSHILEKLNLQDRTQLAIFAIRKGWVEAE